VTDSAFFLSVPSSAAPLIPAAAFGVVTSNASLLLRLVYSILGLQELYATFDCLAHLFYQSFTGLQAGCFSLKEIRYHLVLNSGSPARGTKRRPFPFLWINFSF
jgi:hypothetical protein